jgi:hypothetical protein
MVLFQRRALDVEREAAGLAAARLGFGRPVSHARNGVKVVFLPKNN